MSTLDYLVELTKELRFKEYPSLNSKLLEFQAELQQDNTELCQDFLKTKNLEHQDRDKITKTLWDDLSHIDTTIQQSWQADFSTTDGTQNFINNAASYLPKIKGYFLKESTAKRLITDNPVNTTTSKTHSALLTLAIGRYSKTPNWNHGFLKQLKSLTANDFEFRNIETLIIDHKDFPDSAQDIIDKKCFNTHDKLVGVHLIATLPTQFSLKGKSPVLRTLSKMLHYHKEMELFSQSFVKIQKTPHLDFGLRLASIIRSHCLGSSMPLFNPVDIIEGLSNIYLHKNIKSLAKEFPILKPYLKVHHVAHLHNNQCLNLSLWRLTAWQLKGSLEHSLQMYKDDVIANFLISLMGSNQLEQTVITSLMNGSDHINLAECPQTTKA